MKWKEKIGRNKEWKWKKIVGKENETKKNNERKSEAI